MNAPGNQTDRQPDTGDAARWMTFAELAKARGISKDSAVTLVRRRGWRRQRDNQGHVIALVPLTWTIPEAAGQSDYQPDRPKNPPYSQGDTTAFEAALASVREAKDSEISAWRERAVTAEGRADRAEQALAGERARADGLRERLDEAQSEAAKQRTAVQEALQVAETARAEARATRAAAEAARIAQAEAEADAAEIRQAEMARKARGLLARLRGAWRGD